MFHDHPAICLLASQTFLTFYAELLAWAIARRRYEGMIARMTTTWYVAAEQAIAALTTIVLVEQPSLSSRIVVGLAGVVGAIIGWVSAGKFAKHENIV